METRDTLNEYGSFGDEAAPRVAPRWVPTFTPLQARRRGDGLTGTAAMRGSGCPTGSLTVLCPLISDSATANTGVAIADLYPRVSLGASFGLESVGTTKLNAWGARDWSVGPSISLPVFDHGRRTSMITLRKLEQQEAAVSYQQTVLKAWHEVDDAVSGYVADVRHCAQLAEKVMRSEEDMSLAKARVASGTTSDLPNLDAQSALSRAQRDLVQSAAQRNVALAALYKALGDDGEGHIATVPQVADAKMIDDR